MADNIPQIGQQVQRYLTGDVVVDRALGLLPPMPTKITPRKRSDLHPLVQQTLSPEAAAFYNRGSQDVTVLTDNPMYEAASNEGDKLAQYLYASAILHERTHAENPGQGEEGPYSAQLKFLQSYKLKPGLEEWDRYHKAVTQLQELVKQAQRSKHAVQ